MNKEMTILAPSRIDSLRTAVDMLDGNSTSILEVSAGEEADLDYKYAQTMKYLNRIEGMVKSLQNDATAVYLTTEENL